MLKIRFYGLDKISLLFTSWMLIYIAVGWQRVQEPMLHFPAFLSIIILIVLLAWLDSYLHERGGNNKLTALVGFVRNYYPILFYLYFFEVNTAVNKVVFREWLDPLFYRIDHWLWGYYPSLEWANMLEGYFFQELLHFAYFCYYPMIALLPVLFFFKKRDALRELVFCLSFVFYICYWIYSWLPVIGGRYFESAMELTTQYRYGLFTRIMAYIYTHSPHLGGAFPSSHVAIAIVLSIAAYRYFRRLGSVLFVITALLAVATVYCHYHWFIDSVAGVALGIGGYFAALATYRKLPENRNA